MGMAHEFIPPASIERPVRYIEPVHGYVTGVPGEGALDVDIVAPVDEVASASGAIRAAKHAVREQVGPGVVTVSGEIIDELIEAGRTAPASEAEVVEVPETDFDADLAANGLAVYFPATEGDQIEPTLQAETNDEVEGLHLESAGVHEAAKPELRMAVMVGEAALNDVESVADVSQGSDDLRPEHVEEAPEEAKAIGELLLSTAVVLIDSTGETEDMVVEANEAEVSEQTEPVELLITEYAELEEISAETAVGMLAILATMRTTETNEVDDQNAEAGFVMTDADMAFMALAARSSWQQEQEPATTYALAA